jgi:putative SOS response-associated peptidase YedK
MCGRFQATTSAAELARVFKTTGPLPNLQPRYNAAPTQSLPTVLRDRESGERRLEALRWGLIPYWAKDATIAAGVDQGVELHRAGGGALETTVDQALIRGLSTVLPCFISGLFRCLAGC